MTHCAYFCAGVLYFFFFLLICVFISLLILAFNSVQFQLLFKSEFACFSLAFIVSKCLVVINFSISFSYFIIMWGISDRGKHTH